MESLEEAVTCSAYDLQGWVVIWHCYFGGRGGCDVAGGDCSTGVAGKGDRECGAQRKFGHWL